LGQVIAIDLVLADDNAIVVGMAAAGIPLEQRPKVIFWGIGAAIVLRDRPNRWQQPTLYVSRTWPIESGKEAKPLIFNGCRCEGLHYTMVARRPPIL
jgi:hypothetical protein